VNTGSSCERSVQWRALAPDLAHAWTVLWLTTRLSIPRGYCSFRGGCNRLRCELRPHAFSRLDRRDPRLPSEARWHGRSRVRDRAATFIVSFGRGTTRSRDRPAGVVAGVSPATWRDWQPARLHRQRRIRRPEIKGQAEIRDQRSEVSSTSYFLLPTFLSLCAGCSFSSWGSTLVSGFHERERDLVRGEQWTVRWPESAPGFSHAAHRRLVQKQVAVRSGSSSRNGWRRARAGATAERAPICSMFFFRGTPAAPPSSRAGASA